MYVEATRHYLLLSGTLLLTHYQKRFRLYVILTYKLNWEFIIMLQSII